MNWQKNGERIMKAPLLLYIFIDQDFMAVLEDMTPLESEQLMVVLK